ncbi:MAG: heme ABC transporter permease [Alphaproteobacteria bacterium]|nr:heme ABC transporter permease [Alphaproteobacteria bacterium]
MHKYANPNQFLRIANPLLPWFSGVTVLCIGAALYLGLFTSPPDYQQGDTVRIMYIHVPSAWMAMFVYGSMAIASATALIWRHPPGHMITKASAPIGACFTMICLLTGSLWGKPMWGTWWQWDARMTSVLILFFIYIGYIALVNAFDDSARGQRTASVLVLVGAVNLPIIKFSVEWWNTLHQPASVVRFDGPAIHPSMLWPLLIMSVGFTTFYLVVLILRLRGELAATKIRNLRLGQADA